MKRNNIDPYGMPPKKKNSAISNILLAVAILLLLIGGALLLVDPIKAYKRQEKVDEAVAAIQNQITLNDTEATAMTFVVSVEGNEVNGEDYDYFGDDDEILRQQQEVASELASYGDTVTLNGLGIIDIDCVNIHLPIWDEATVITLRYGSGHYTGSVLPGEIGNCTILGHHMSNRDSMFHNVDDLVEGDPITITTVDGRRYVYIVDETVLINPSELPDYIPGDITETRQLTLVTCRTLSTGRMRYLVIAHMADD